MECVVSWTRGCPLPAKLPFRGGKRSWGFSRDQGAVLVAPKLVRGVGCLGRSLVARLLSEEEVGAGEVGEVDEHEGVQGSVGEHGLEGDVVGREERERVLEEAAQFDVAGGLAGQNFADVRVENLQRGLQSHEGALE